MPRVLTKKPAAPDTEAVYVCVMPFASGNDVVSQGTRLRGSHRLVRESPHYFVLDGTPQNEWPNMWDGIEPVQHEPEFTPPKRTLPLHRVEDVVICAMGYRRLDSGENVPQGTIAHVSHPRVVANPEYWQPLEVEVYPS